jgi:hypothetical protein
MLDVLLSELYAHVGGMRLAFNNRQQSLIGIGGPWWLLQIWLNLHTMKVVDRPPLSDAEFLRFEPITDEDGEEITKHRCMSFGEAASQANVGSKLSAELFRDWFINFYDGFPRSASIWFAYGGFASFKLLADF